MSPGMTAEMPKAADRAAALAQALVESLHRERIVPRFVDSYVVEHGRQALQVHAGMYRDLLGLLHREALLAASARALEASSWEKPRDSRSKPKLKPRSEIGAFRRKFLAAMARQQRWTAGDALDFQSDLQMYEHLIARAAEARRPRKPFEAANHPFVDRCAFLLDSSFGEGAPCREPRACGAGKTGHSHRGAHGWVAAESAIEISDRARSPRRAAGRRARPERQRWQSRR